MRQIIISFSIIIVMSTGSNILMAQDAFTTTGGDIKNTEGSVSFSIGQVLYSNFTGEDGMITEGVQQPYEIYVITSIDDIDDITLSVKAFPNPVINLLNLSIEETNTYNLHEIKYHLINFEGRLIRSQILSNNTTAIDMTFLLPGIYFLNVMYRQQVIKTFKIMKHAAVN